MQTTLIDEAAAQAQRNLAANSAKRRDLRSHPRFSFTASARAVEIASGARIDARTTDLGRGGCYVDTMNPFPVGTMVRLRLTKDGMSFRLDARVVYSQVGVGMGLQFTAVPQEQLVTLESWLHELSGEAPQETGALEQDERVLSENDLKDEQRYALEELLVLLMRKGLLAEEEGEPILRRLVRSAPARNSA